MLPDPQTAFDVPSFQPEMAFPCLTEEMIRCIRSYSTEAEYDNGTQLSAAGQREADMFVVLAQNWIGFGVQNWGRSFRTGRRSRDLQPAAVSQPQRMSVSAGSGQPLTASRSNVPLERDHEACPAIGLEPESGFHRLMLAEDILFCGRSVIIATGARYRKLRVQNLDRFENQGVYYAATAMDAAFCRNNEVIVVGAGNSAGQAALFLSHRAAHVCLMIRGTTLAQTMSQYLLSRIETSPRISVLTETEIVSLAGDSRLNEVTWIDRRSGVQKSKRIDSVFLMIGAEPNTQWLNGLVNLDEEGFVKMGGPAAFEQTPHATNLQGIYAVGDVRSGSVKRVASGVGEGSVVISDIHGYLAQRVGILDESSVCAQRVRSEATTQVENGA